MPSRAWVRTIRYLLVGWLLPCIAPASVHAENIEKLNRCLAGRVVAFARSQRRGDCRIWSESLGLPRDLYVYLPPGYDSAQAYPLFLWIHGFGGDEEQFTRQVVRALDAAIVAGDMPPVIAAAPDVSVPSRWKPWCQGSWCINGRQGRWEDYVTRDVLSFVGTHFKVRPEREARMIAGWSMGGFAAYNLGFKHPDQFGMLIGIYPNLNIRYSDKAGHWGGNFDANAIGWLNELRWGHWVGLYPWPWRFPIPCGVVFWPAWGRDEAAIERMSQENPYELLERLDIRDGLFDLFVAYGREDEYNVDAQVDSFLHRAGERGIRVWVRCNPDGHHSSPYVNECMPDVLVAVGKKLHERLARLDASHASSTATSRSAVPEASAAHAAHPLRPNAASAPHPVVTLARPNDL